MSNDFIINNLNKVNQTIRDSAIACGRDPKDITLIAVSKTKPVSLIQRAYDAGIRDFGENRVQELKEKMPALPGDIRWHMIGHLQRNKVKDVVGKVFLIHSVDSLELAREISRISVKKEVITHILLEVNPAGEINKTGIKSTDGIISLIKEVASLPALIIKGLMTVPPIEEREDVLQGYFKALKDLSLEVKAKNIENVHMEVLSMGMTGDYPIAIREGSTHVRVGTGIFGEREVY